jgi:NADP-dependent 3-hydroxy acid dehydrogenase YdfG
MIEGIRHTGIVERNQDFETFLDPKDVAEYIIFCISFESNTVTNEIFLKRLNF